MVVLRRRGTAKNLADKINDCVASGTQFTNDFEFCGRNVLSRAVGDKTERFALEGNSLANNVAVGKDILGMGGDGRVLLGWGRRRGVVVREGGRVVWTRDDLRKGRGRKRGGREGGKRSGNGEGRREGEAILRQVGVDATLLGQGNSETMRTKL